MKLLLKAIVDDDQKLVKELIAKDPRMVRLRMEKPTPYREKIFHWIYAGDTVLHLAAAGYRVEIIRELLRAGADPNAAGTHRGGTPLHYAADGCTTCPVWNAERQVETIRVLLEAGANINAPDKNGATPLHRAVRTRCAEAVKYLLDVGADPLLKNKPGSTPFHLAVQNTGRGGSGAPEAIAAQKKIIEEFLSRRVSADVKSANDKTVRDCAQSEWIRMLLT